MYSVCILIYVFMYLCIYIATHLHTLYLDWLQAVLESNSRCAWKWPSSELRDILPGCDWATLEMHLEAVIKCSWRYTWRPWLNEFGDMHLEAMILWTFRPDSSKFGDALGGHDRANLQAVFEPVWRYTWRLRSSELGDALGGRDRASLDEYLEAVDGRHAGTQFIR